MDHGHGKIRMKVESDRLSNLPDDIIHKILSFIGFKQAIETSALSSRWRHIWTSMPYLNFSSDDFQTLPKFTKFVKHVLSDRNNQIEVSTLELHFNVKVSQAFVRRIFDYAVSHNVQQLNIWCLRGKIEYPPCLFSSLTLKHLTFGDELYIMTPHTWKLSALATLKLFYVTLYDDNTIEKGDGLFSNCANLKNLSLNDCTMMGRNVLNICHPGLTSLTFENCCMDANVVTPQLKNLAIKDWRKKFMISAPNLTSFHYDDRCHPMEFSADFLHLEEVDIRIFSGLNDKTEAHKVVCLLQQLHSVKFLTLNSEMITVLSEHVELISHQRSPFVNLKSLKIYPVFDGSMLFSDCLPPELTMSNICAEVKYYLLDSSPGANFTIVSREEMQAIRNANTTRKLMRELQVLLDRWKEKSGTNSARIKRDKAPMVNNMATVCEQGEVENHKEPDSKMKSHFEEKVAHIERYWEDVNAQLEKGYKNTCSTISMLRRIEGLLKEVPRSDRDKLEARYFGLRAEAEIMMDNGMNHMKIQCAQ